jgi:AraC-like DNA-binding protein
MRLSTDELPSRDRFALFREGLVARLAALEMIRHETIPFRGEFSLVRASAVSVARLDTSPVNFLRTPKLLNDDDDSICLAICRKGRYHTSQNGNEQLLRPGDGVVLDVARVAALQVLGQNSSRWSVKLPRERVAAAVPSVDALGGGKLPGGSHVQRLLLHCVEGAESIGLPTGLPAAALFDDHIFDLAIWLLGAQGDTRDIAEHRGLRYARRQAILREIETNFAEPGLSAAVVAARLGITARYVHRLLEETGKTFSDSVLERRLSRTMQLLTDPRRTHQKIIEIAFESGFVELSRFNRSFRARYGDTPSGVRTGLRRPKHRE